MNLGLSEWALNAITNVLMRDVAKEHKQKMRQYAHRDRVGAMSPDLALKVSEAFQINFIKANL